MERRRRTEPELLHGCGHTDIRTSCEWVVHELAVGNCQHVNSVTMAAAAAVLRVLSTRETERRRMEKGETREGGGWRRKKGTAICPLPALLPPSSSIICQHCLPSSERLSRLPD